MHKALCLTFFTFFTCLRTYALMLLKVLGVEVETSECDNMVKHLRT